MNNKLIMNDNYIKINKKYVLLEKIGEGSFGSIFKGKNFRTNELVAIKVEPIYSNLKLIKNETIIYQYLKGIKGIPDIKWFGKDTINYYMVINLLGKSLQQLKNENYQFTLDTIKYLESQIVELLNNIHKNGIIHRDIKPDNFLFDLEFKKIYLIDFGLAKVVNDNTNEVKKTSGIIGNVKFASINNHKFIEQGKKDDLESLLYVLIYLYLDKDIFNINDNNKLLQLKENIHIYEVIPIYFKNKLSSIK